MKIFLMVVALVFVVSKLGFAEEAYIKNQSGSDLIYSYKANDTWTKWSFLDDGRNLEIPVTSGKVMFRYYEGEEIRYFDLESNRKYDFKSRQDRITLFETRSIPENKTEEEGKESEEGTTDETKEEITPKAPEVFQVMGFNRLIGVGTPGAWWVGRVHLKNVAEQFSARGLKFIVKSRDERIRVREDFVRMPSIGPNRTIAIEFLFTNTERADFSDHVFEIRVVDPDGKAVFDKAYKVPLRSNF